MMNIVIHRLYHHAPSLPKKSASRDRRSNKGGNYGGRSRRLEPRGLVLSHQAILGCVRTGKIPRNKESSIIKASTQNGKREGIEKESKKRVKKKNRWSSRREEN